VESPLYRANWIGGSNESTSGPITSAYDLGSFNISNFETFRFTYEGVDEKRMYNRD